MKQLFLWGSMFWFCAATQATPIDINECVGLDTATCSAFHRITGRSIDSYLGDPGTLVASASTPITGNVLNPDNTVSTFVVGTLVSAAYREQPNTDGHFTLLTFYYQFQANAALPTPVESLSFSLPPSLYNRIFTALPTDVGQRQGGLPAGGFVASSGFLSSITMSNTGDYSVDWSRTPVAAGSASPIFGVRSPYVYYGFENGARLSTRPAFGFVDGRNYASPSSGGILSVDNAPEPGTWGLFGLGLAACAWVRKKHARII